MTRVAVIHYDIPDDLHRKAKSAAKWFGLRDVNEDGFLSPEEFVPLSAPSGQKPAEQDGASTAAPSALPRQGTPAGGPIFCTGPGQSPQAYTIWGTCPYHHNCLAYLFNASADSSHCMSFCVWCPAFFTSTNRTPG